jgi:hypothetical protein
MVVIMAIAFVMMAVAKKRYLLKQKEAQQSGKQHAEEHMGIHPGHLKCLR